MKKFLLCALMLVTVLALVACGGQGNDTTVPSVEDSGNAGGDPSAHVHAFAEAVVVEPTCTSLGKKAMVCSCGDVEAGSEMPLPFAEHDAKAATCTEDSVCATCAKLLVEKYGHLYVDSIITEATCTTNGLAKSECHRCGDKTETVVEASHTYDASAIVVSKGNVGSTCTKCNQVVNFGEKNVILKLDFDSAAEIDAATSFKVIKPATMTYENSTLKLAEPLWFGYTSDMYPQNSKLLLSFDFKLTKEGLTHRGESIFTFVAGRSAYNWLIKFYQASGVISTADANFTDSNSVPATLNKWYNCVAVIDTAKNSAAVYIDGKFIGNKAIPNHSDAKYNNNFELRFFDVKSNGVSEPVFDNFKLVEIK